MNGKTNELMKFEDTEVEIIEIKGEPHFEIYSTGMALGQIVRNAIGVAYPNKARIDRNLENAGVEPCLRGANKYINEAQLYDLMLEMKTDKCKPFRKWVTTEVLPSLRRNGTYSLSEAQARIYPPKATSVGEVAQLLKVYRATLKDEKQTPTMIAQVVKAVSEQFGISLPDDFVKHEQEPLQQLALVGVFWTEQS